MSANQPSVSQRDPWRGALFDDVLRGIGPQSSAAYWPAFHAPWGVSFERDWAVFHVVVQGTCWLQAKGVAEPVELSAGDLAVVTKGQFHTIRDVLSTPAVTFAELVRSHARGKRADLRFGGDGPVTRLVCGGIESREGHPLMAILPPILHLKGSAHWAHPWIRLTTQHILRELDGGETGSKEVADRLVDVLFLHAVRGYFDENVETADSGWLAAVRDRHIGRALAAIHSHPHRRWTVASLGRHLAMSRTIFAARFKELVGEPPQHYFTRLRINTAAVRLHSSRDKLSAIAADAGYRSVPAFIKSFKRHIGMTPGEYRDRRDGWPL